MILNDIMRYYEIVNCDRASSFMTFFNYNNLILKVQKDSAMVNRR